MAAGEVEIVAQTTCGPVRGLRSGDGISAFKGIPYAAPPVGPLRWRKPEPHESWGPGVLDCTNYRASAMEIPSLLSQGPALPGGMDESCLHLNVWTPGWEKSNTKLPVFVWIHGGGLISHADAWWNAAMMSSHGLVVVTINYRLGVLGFIRPKGDADYNCGLWDQVEALRWIKKNISNFGGDPESVTIAGQSAGGLSVVCLMASPVANKLFKRAIPMATNPQCVPDITTMNVIVESFTTAAMGNPAATAEDMRALSVDEVMATQSGERNLAPGQDYIMLSSPGWYQNVWPGQTLGKLYKAAGRLHTVIPASDEVPIVAGAVPCVIVVGDELLPRMPLDLLADGSAAHIDILVGSNREELSFRPSPSDPESSAENTFGGKVNSVDHAIQRCAREIMALGAVTEPLKTARALVESYLSKELVGGAAPAGTIQHAWNRLCSDICYNASTVMVAARQHRHRPGKTFVYSYDGNRKRNSFHGWEVMFALGNLPEGYKNNEKMGKLQDSMLGSFTRFACTGDPNGAPGVPYWASWGTTDLNGNMMHFDLAGNSAGRYDEHAPAIGKVVEFIDDVYLHSSRTFQQSRL